MACVSVVKNSQLKNDIYIFCRSRQGSITIGGLERRGSYYDEDVTKRWVHISISYRESALLKKSCVIYS